MLRIIVKDTINKDNANDTIEHLLKINPSLQQILSMALGRRELDKLLGKQVKEESKIDMLSDSVLITKEHLDKMHEDFLKHYTAAKPSVAFNDIRLNWADFVTEMNDVLNPIPLAYKFIHRFDGTSWFLTAQQSGLEKYGNIGNPTTLQKGNPVFDIRDDGSSYEVYQPNLAAASGNYYDELYMSDTTGYDLDPGKPYDQSKRVWSITLPAQELRLLIQHNLFLGGNDQDYEINFKCITREINDAKYSLVRFPHCVAVYASKNGVPCLTPGSVVIVGAPFRSNAGDLDSLCPPNCNQYFWPDDLPA